MTGTCQVLGWNLTQKLNLGLGQNLNLGPHPEPELVPVPELDASLSELGPELGSDPAPKEIEERKCNITPKVYYAQSVI